jgi:hypothetical protein
MTLEVLEAEEVILDNPPRMVHWVAYANPDIAICGRRLRGDWASPDTPIECAVCIDLVGEDNAR